MPKFLTDLTSDEKKQLCAAYYTKDINFATNWTYHCNKCTHAPKKQQTGSGLTNLLDHINRVHDGEWREVMSEILKGPQGNIQQYLTKTASKAAENIFWWIEWVIATDQSFRFVENKYVKKNTKLKHIGRNTFQKYMELIYIEVKSKIKNMLPEDFGVIFDGTNLICYMLFRICY